jgi:predicted DCC family thiol-disulfide oxidoreductase YuxK
MQTAAGEAGSVSPLPRGAAIVLYDGVCALCNGAVRFTLARDHDRPCAREALARHGEKASDLDTMYVLADCGEPAERLLARSEGVLYLLHALGGGWRNLARLASLLPRRLRDRLYGFVVRRRYRWFGKYDACPLPHPELRDRFID